MMLPDGDAFFYGVEREKLMFGTCKPRDKAVRPHGNGVMTAF